MSALGRHLVPNELIQDCEFDKVLKKLGFTDQQYHKNTLACENPECCRTDRPLYLWHAVDGRHSMFLCDICFVKTEAKNSSNE